MKKCPICEVIKPRSEFYARKDSADGLRNDCKSCTKSRTRSYALANPEKIQAWQATYVDRYPARVKESKRAHYERNRDVIIGRARKWVEDNPERRAATWRAWYATNPLSRHAAAQRRRAALAGADIRVITERDWTRLLARYGGLCAYCRNRPATCRDHVVPISKGGRHSIGNLLPACGRCNRSKKDRLLSVWLHRP